MKWHFNKHRTRHTFGDRAMLRHMTHIIYLIEKVYCVK